MDTKEQHSFYAPLDPEARQFRILKVQPGETEQLYCNLQVVAFDGGRAPEYETISYVWGDASARGELVVDGQLFDAPESSVQVIRRIRLPDEVRTIWIDAVCIDQKNDNERSQQVQLMGDIYSNGTTNLIYWIDEQPLVQSALRSVRDLVEEADEGGHLARLYNTNGVIKFVDKNLIKTQYDEKAFTLLFDCQWLRRVWTFQEAFLAKRNMCLCGESSIGLLVLLRASTWLLCNFSFISLNLGRASLMLVFLHRQLDPKYGFYRAKSGPHPLNIMNVIRPRQCLRWADKVYGAVGTMHRLKLVPDYTKCHPEVFQDFAVAMVREYKDLLLLYDVLHDRCVADGFPSWIPDWSENFDEKRHPRRFATSFDAHAQTSPECATKLEHNGHAVLIARGMILGIASACVAPFLGKDELFNQESVVSLIRNTLGTEASAADTDLALATTLCAGFDWQRQPVDESVIKRYQAWVTRKAQKSRIPRPWKLRPDATEEVVLAARYDAAGWAACNNRKLFATAEGHVGLGPDFMELGDVVVIIYGYRRPVVLRRKGEQYIYLGEAYVYGVMHGEAVRRHRDVGGEDVMFEIR